MDEAQVVRIMVFIAHQNSLVVLQPCKQPLNFLSPFIPAEFAPVLCLRFHTIRFMRSDQLNTYLRQFLVQRPLCSGTSPFYSDRILSLAIIPMVDRRNCRVLSLVKTGRFFSALSNQIDTKYKICEEP